MAFGTSVPWFDPHGKLPGALDAAKAAGLKHIRFDIAWETTETEPGHYKWRNVDAVVKAIHRRGLKPLAILTYTPQWAAPAPENYHGEPRDQHRAAWRDFVRAAVKRYGARITEWEIWNEPNIDLFWYPTPSAREYVPFLRDAYTTIKKFQPGSSSTVVSAGLAPVGARSAGSVPPTEYLREMYAAGAKGYFDVLGMHPYTNDDPTDPDRPGKAYDGWTQTKMMRGQMVAHGNGRKKVWLTEFGFSMGDHARAVTESEQATYLSNALAEFDSFGWVERSYLYTMVDLETFRGQNQGSDYERREKNFGLLEDNLQPKDSYGSVSQIAKCQG